MVKSKYIVPAKSINLSDVTAKAGSQAIVLRGTAIGIFSSQSFSGHSTAGM